MTPAEVSDEVVNAAQQADYEGKSRHRAWQRVPDHQVRRLIAGAVTAERERIRQRLVGCPACHEIHGEEQETDHPNKAPWRPRGPNALEFLDELLGDGPLP